MVMVRHEKSSGRHVRLLRREQRRPRLSPTPFCDMVSTPQPQKQRNFVGHAPRIPLPGYCFLAGFPGRETPPHWTSRCSEWWGGSGYQSSSLGCGEEESGNVEQSMSISKKHREGDHSLKPQGGDYTQLCAYGDRKWQTAVAFPFLKAEQFDC